MAETVEKRIEIEPIDFKSTGDFKDTTSEGLGILINDMFSQIFKDYYGCKLTVQYQQQQDRGVYIVVPCLLFQVLPADKYADGVSAFKPLAAINDSNIVNRVQRLTQIATTSGAKVSVTDDAKSMLAEFMVKPKNQAIDWSTCYRSIGTDTGTYIEMFKLDINKLLKKLFGSKDSNGSDLYYQIIALYKLNTNNQYHAPDNWALQINRLYNDNLIESANLYGMYVQPKSGINVITATSTSK